MAVCIALEPGDNYYFVDVYINGIFIRWYQKKRMYHKYGKDSNELCFFSTSIQFLQKHLNDSNPAERNHFEVTYKIHFDGPKPQNPKVIKRWGVHVDDDDYDC